MLLREIGADHLGALPRPLGFGRRAEPGAIREGRCNTKRGLTRRSRARYSLAQATEVVAREDHDARREDSRGDRAVSLWADRRPAAPRGWAEGDLRAAEREGSGACTQIPGSRRQRVAAETIRDWLAAYRAGGFDALRPRAAARPGPAACDPAGDLGPAVPDQGGDPGAVRQGADRAGAQPERTGRSVAGSGHGPPPALAAGADGEAACRADEQGPPPLLVRQGGRAVDERRDARAGGRRRERPQEEELPDRASRRRDAGRAVRRLRALGEHHRLSAGAAAGDPAAGHPQAALRRQRLGVPLAAALARVRQARHHADPREALPAAGQRQAGALVSLGTHAAAADARRGRSRAASTPSTAASGRGSRASTTGTRTAGSTDRPRSTAGR